MVAARTVTVTIPVRDGAGNVTDATIDVPVSASTATGTRLGINTHGPWMNSYWTANLYPLLWPLGVQHIRVDVSWSLIESGTGPSTLTGGTQGYDSGQLADIDLVMAAMSAHNVSVLAVITGLPSWAGPTASNTPAQFAAFASWLVKRYPVIEAVEVINEAAFNYSAFTSGAYYTNILKAAYGAIKAARSAVTVTTGSTLNCQWGDPRCGSYLTAINSNGGFAYCDAINVHNYAMHVWSTGNGGKYPALTEYTTPVFDPAKPDASILGMYQTQVLPRLTAWGVSKPCWFTEFGWNVQSLTEQQVADKYGQLSTLLGSAPWDPSLVRLYPYQLANAHAAISGDDGWGIIKVTGSNSAGYTYAQTAAYAPFQSAPK